MKITINKKDLEKYMLNFTMSGQVIDELAYSAKQWTEDELEENNYAYEPMTPYDFNYEDDLLENTKTEKQLYSVAKTLGISLNTNLTNHAKKKKLQAGAFMALETPDAWAELLEAYKDSLDENRTESMSKAYNEQLLKEINGFYDELYKEWLYGDYRDFRGVVYEIAKYFTQSQEGDYDKKLDEYTFTLDEDDITEFQENYNDQDETGKVTPTWIKWKLLDSAFNSSTARQDKDKREREKNKAERERLTAYKAKQAKEKAEAREAKLRALKAK